MAWGGRKNATLSLPQTGLSARFARRFVFFFPQCGAWSQITWFLPLLLFLRFVILRYNSKYQSKGQIYILHLFSFQKKSKNKKRDSGKPIKRCGMPDFRRKRERMGDQHPSPPLLSRPWLMQTKFNWALAHSTLRPSHTRLATSRPLGERSEHCLASKRPTASDEVARGRPAPYEIRRRTFLKV